jgi:hypothetical protein
MNSDLTSTSFATSKSPGRTTPPNDYISVDTAQEPSTVPAPKCPVCDDAVMEDDLYYPWLCDGCRNAGSVGEEMDLSQDHWGDSRPEVIKSVLARLRNDKTAIRAIQQYSALLRYGVACHLFLDPVAPEPQECFACGSELTKAVSPAFGICHECYRDAMSE